MTETDMMQVLHVDNDPYILDLTTRFLAETDIPIVLESTTSVEDAQETLATVHVECVVCDRDALRRGLVETIRQYDEELPVLLFTVDQSNETIHEALDAGVTDYKRKEYDSGQYRFLANRIRTLVEKYRAETQTPQSSDIIQKQSNGHG